jgi:hypothetical protein
MASTVKEFAIKISADTKELQSNINKVTKTFTKLQTKVKNVFKSVDKDIQRAAKNVNKAINKMVGEVGKNAEKQMKQVVAATKKLASEVRKGTQAEVNAHKNAAKEINNIRSTANKDQEKLLRQQTQEAAKELKNQIKQLDREAEQFGDIDVVRINRTQPIKDVQELGRVIKSSNKTTQEEIRTQLKRLDGQKIEDIKDAEQKLIRILTQAQKNQVKAAKEAAKRRLKQANLTAEKRLEIAKKLQRQLQRIQEQGTARRQATRQTARKREDEAPKERRVGRIGRGGALISEIGGAAQRSAGQLGVFGQALGKLGPIGIAVGAGLAVVVGTFLKAADAAGKLGNEIAKVKTTINPKQFDELGGATQRLRDFSAQTGVELSELTDGMFNAASAVTAFKDDVNAGAEAVIIASKAAVGMNTDSGNLVSVMGDLANSFGINASNTENLNFIMDTVSQTFRDGKISGDELSSTIVKAAKSTSLLSADAKVGLTALNAMTASMTASGINAAETATAIDALQNEFLDLPKATKLIEAGLGGISTEGGKVQVDFQKLFESAEGDFEKYAQLLGSKRAKLAFRTLADAGESSFLAISKGFDDVSGRSETAFNIMQDTSEAATKRLDASFNELMISIGGAADSMVTNVTNMAASALQSIADLFTSSAQEAAESQELFNQSIETAAKIGETIAEVDKALEDMGPLSAGQVEEEINRIGEAANQFKDQFPLIAENIQNIINAEGEKTVETIAMLNEQLGRAQELAQAEAFLAGFEGAQQGVEAIGDAIDAAAGSTLEWTDAIFALGPIGAGIGAIFRGEDFLGELESRLEGISELDVLGSLNAQMDGVTERLKQLDEERNTIDKNSEEGAARLREINLEIKDLMGARREAAAGIANVETTIEKQVAQQLENAKNLAASLGEELDVQREIENIRFNIVEETGAEGETLKLINDTLREKGVLIAEELGQRDISKQLQIEELDLRIQNLQAQMRALDLFGGLSDEHKAMVDAQIEALEAQKESVSAAEEIADANDENLDISEDQLSAEEELVKVKQEKADLTEEESFIKEAVNDLTSEILDNETLTTEEKITQLDELIAQQDAQLEILDAQIKQLEAAHGLQLAMASNNELSAEAQDKALATAEAMREQIAALKEEVAIVETAKEQLEGKKTETETEERVRGTIGGVSDRDAKRQQREAQRAERDRERDAAKAEKEREKEKDRAQKEMQRQEKEAAKAKEKLEEEREKRREEDAKRMQEFVKAEVEFRKEQLRRQAEVAKMRFEAEQKAIESIRDFRLALEQTIASTRAELSAGLSEAVSDFSTLKEEFEDIASSVSNLVKKTEAETFRMIREQFAITQQVQKTADATLIGLQEDLQIAILDAIPETLISDSVAAELARTIQRDFVDGVQTFKIINRIAKDNAEITLEEARTIVSPLTKIAETVDRSKIEELRPAIANINTALRTLGIISGDTNLNLGQLTLALKELEAEAEERGEKLVLTEPVEADLSVNIPDVEEIGQFTTLAQLFEKLGNKLGGALAAFESAGTADQLEKAGLGFERLTEDLDLANFSLRDIQEAYSGVLNVIEILNLELDQATGTEEERIEKINQLKAELNEEELELLETIKAQGNLSQKDLAILRTKVPLLIRQTEQLQQQVEAQARLAETQAALLNNQERFSNAIQTTNQLANEYEAALMDQEITVESINNKYDEQLEKLRQAKSDLLIAERLLTKQDERLENQIIEQERLLEAEKKKTEELRKQIEMERPEGEELTEEQIEEIKKEIDALNISMREREDIITGLNEKEQENQEELNNTTEALENNTEAQENNTAAREESLQKLKEQKTTEFIQEMNAQAQKLNTTSFTGFLSTIGDTTDSISALFTAARNETGETAEKLREAALQNLGNLAGAVGTVFEQTFANVEQGFDQIQNIMKQFKAGVSGAVTEASGDITTKIGRALLSAPTPGLQIAGAVLLGVGLITKAVGKIINAIKGREQTALEKAEERLATIERQNAEMRNQLDLMSDLAAMGDSSVDTARERLALLEQQRESLIAQNAAYGIGQKELLQQQTLWEDQVELLDEYKGRFESAREFSNSDQRKLIKAFNDTFGTAFDFGDNVRKSDIDDVVAFIDRQIANSKGTLSEFELITELNEQILQEQFNLLDERIGSAKFRIRIATEFEDPSLFIESQADFLQTLGDRLNTALLQAGVGEQITDLTRDELLTLRDNFEKLFDKGEVPQNVIDSWTELLEAIENNDIAEREFVEAMLQDEEQQKELIKLREEAGKIDENTSKEQRIELLEEEIDIVEEQIEALGESVELEMLLLSLQKELNDLKNEGNSEDEEANRLLTIALRKRQELLEMIRAEQKGAPITVQQQDMLNQSEDEIRRQLEATGMTPEQIDSFINTLPAFEQGGIVPDTGLALVHKGELIIPANQIKEMEDQIRMFSNGVVAANPIVNGTDPLTQAFSRIILEKEAQNINNTMINVNIGDIINNIPETNTDPKQIIEAINVNIKDTIMGTVQRGLDQNKLDLRGKKT